MTKDNGGQAFPAQFDFMQQDDLSRQEGMSLRDYFAGQRLVGSHGWGMPEIIAKECYEYAAALIAERTK